MESKTLPAGPSGNLIAGCAEELKDDPLGFLSRCQRDYGDFVPFRAATMPMLLICDPELIQEVLVSKAASFSKDIAIKNNRRFFGDGLLSSEGDYWRRHRKLASPSFSPRKLEEYATAMVAHGQLRLTNWHDGVVLDIQSEMMRTTLSIAVRTLFESEIESKEGDLEKALTDAQHFLAERMENLIVLMLPEWVPFPTNRHLHEAIEKVDKVIYGLIKDRRGHTEGRTDLLSTLIDVRDDDGSGLSDKEIRDEVFTLFFAGHETTALTLTWTLYLLSQNPQVEEKLLAEIDQVIGGRLPAASDYYKLPYLEKVIYESMRLRPPVWGIGREAIEDCEIGGYPVKKGTAIFISQWVNHHDHRYFPEPEKFDPDRWTSDFQKNLPKFAYFPFGGGPRICIGNSFAMLEAMLLLVCILRDFHLETAADQSIELLPAVTLRPKNGIKMIARARSR